MIISPPPVDGHIDAANKSMMNGAWVRWFGPLFAFLQNLQDYSTATVQKPVTGFSIQIGDRIKVLTLNPAGALATGAVIFPANPVDGQPLEVLSTQAVAALSVTANKTVMNAPYNLVAGAGFAYYYNQAALAWFRRY